MNKVFLVGRLTRDLELRYSSSNMAVLRNSLAVDRRGRRNEETEGNNQTADFISIVAFGQTAETMNKFLQKGSQIAIDGRIQTGSYEKDGRTVYTTDVIVDNFDFCGRKGDADTSSIPESNNNTSTNNSSSDNIFSDFGQSVSMDDELPF